ncbi:DEAD/DEAH box helicase [Microbulbifer celer]|uniref:DEAD/DEAH box helicase n=1 Tax=Microbulbifer celer TaxID=435905 RepID=A0ABW3U6D5_9GAMM|nr:ATP-binding protein [Microbulbifer celer]UFN58606.1 ATP-binding protein [Microbulbifer celer]
MPHKLSPIIEYFRRCYRADSYDLSISNIEKLPKNRRIYLEGEDELASGSLPRVPLVSSAAENLRELSDSYRRERKLVYCIFSVTGSIASAGGFASQRKLCAPLIYTPATLTRDEDIFLEADATDIRINLPVLRLLLKPEEDSAAVEQFPVPRWPLDTSQVAAMGRWLHKYSVLGDVEELGCWPRLLSGDEVAARASQKGLQLSSTACVVLADRSKGVRGVLHELTLLTEREDLSRPVLQLLSEGGQQTKSSASTPNVLPGLLSEAQKRALHNAAKSGLSLVSGPPGTGKSFTIAAMAIDRILQGESVLIVSKTPQAIDVVGEKLASGYGLQAGFVRAGENGVSQSLKSHLESVLKEGVDAASKPLSEVRKDRDQAYEALCREERRFTRALRGARKFGSSTLPNWLVKVLGAVYGSFPDTETLWAQQASIGRRRDTFEKAATQYLNAVWLNRLTQLLDTERGTLSLFNQALRSRTSKRQAERFAQLDFNVILQAYPIWLVGLDEISQVLPNIGSLFDLVIFDEATQCDIASALPAVQRSKRAVVVGDGKQLRHVSFLSKSVQERIWYDCTGEEGPPSCYRYREHAFLDLTSDMISSQSSVTMLDEHYRSRPELIHFSNRHFYRGRLKIMQSRPGVSGELSLEFLRVAGRRASNGRNKVECEEVIRVVGAHIAQHAASPVKPSIGVLSPYREQAEYLDREVRKAYSTGVLDEYAFRAATPYGFQGEERDLIVLSISIDADSTRAAAYLNRPDMFNVAVTRARKRQLVIHSVDAGSLPPENLFARYLSYDHRENNAGGNDVLCSFAEEVKGALEQAGANSWIGFTIAGHEVDVVCERDGRLLGIDLVGYPGAFFDHFSLQAYHVLHRAGVHMVPLVYRQWKQGREECVRGLLQRLGRG